MDEIKDSDLNELDEINDDQERLHFQLSSKRDIERLNPQKVREQFHELKILQLLLYFLITSGIGSFFILVFMNIHYIIILIDVGVVVVYLFYLKYITHKYRKILKISKEDFKVFFKIKKKSRNISKLKIFFNFMIIFIIILLLIYISLKFRLNPSIIIIVIGVSLLYYFFDRNFEE